MTPIPFSIPTGRALPPTTAYAAGLVCELRPDLADGVRCAVLGDAALTALDVLTLARVEAKDGQGANALSYLREIVHYGGNAPKDLRALFDTIQRLSDLLYDRFDWRASPTFNDADLCLQLMYWRGGFAPCWQHAATPNDLRCLRRLIALHAHAISPNADARAAWAKVHLDALADPSPHGAKMHPTLAAFAASYRHRYPDLVVKTDEDFDLVIEWQQGAESPCHEVYVRIVQDGLRIVLDCDGGHSLTFDEERPTDSLTDAFMRNGAAPILAAPGTFAALVLERCLFRDSAIRPMSPDRLT